MTSCEPIVKPDKFEKDVYWVLSRGRAPLRHRLEVDGKDYNCGCERGFIYSEQCYHIQCVKEFLKSK